MKYQHMNYFLDEDEGISFEIHFEYLCDHTIGTVIISDWQNFETDEIVDLIDHKTDIREYQIKHILENPQKRFLIDFIIENLNEKKHEIIIIDFEDIIINRMQEQDIKAGVAHYDQEIFSSPEMEN